MFLLRINIPLEIPSATLFIDFFPAPHLWDEWCWVGGEMYRGKKRHAAVASLRLAYLISDVEEETLKSFGGGATLKMWDGCFWSQPDKTVAHQASSSRGGREVGEVQHKGQGRLCIKASGCNLTEFPAASSFLQLNCRSGVWFPVAALQHFDWKSFLEPNVPSRSAADVESDPPPHTHLLQYQTFICGNTKKMQSAVLLN